MSSRYNYSQYMLYLGNIIYLWLIYFLYEEKSKDIYILYSVSVNIDFVLTVNTWPVIRRLCFFVMLEAKSIRAGLFRGYPDKTRIWGLKGIKRKLKWYSLIKIVLYLFWDFFFGGGVGFDLVICLFSFPNLFTDTVLLIVMFRCGYLES